MTCLLDNSLLIPVLPLPLANDTFKGMPRSVQKSDRLSVNETICFSSPTPSLNRCNCMWFAEEKKAFLLPGLPPNNTGLYPRVGLLCAGY